jgi:hypothetical protein
MGNEEISRRTVLTFTAQVVAACRRLCAPVACPRLRSQLAADSRRLAGSSPAWAAVEARRSRRRCARCVCGAVLTCVCVCVCVCVRACVEGMK